MPRFNKSNIQELKEFLYSSYDHDAEIESIKCDCENDSIEIALFNPFFDLKIDFTFYNIELTLSIKGNWHGDRKTIIGTTVEEDLSYLGKYLLNYGKYIEDSLYLCFQTFSGDELHIVAKEVIIGCTSKEQ